MADASALVEIVGKQSVSGPAGVAASALSAVESAAGKVGGVLTGVASAALKAGAALATVSAAGVTAALTSATTAAAGFEKQMSAVGAVSGATAEQMKSLQSLALQLGADTSFSASEAAQGLEELVKAGVSIKDIMGGAGKAALDLAAAGAVSVADAAEIASNAMNVFSIRGSEMGHVADVIAGAANASAISVTDYKFSLAAAGAVANTVGINFDDLSTAIAVMGQAGIKGSDAGTSLKTMLMNLQPSTKAQTAEFKRLGLITKDGGNAFFDATGKAKSMAEIAGVLQKATKGMTDQQKLASLEILFGSDAIRAAAVMAKQGTAGFTEMAGAIGKISATDVANKRLDNLAGSIEKFRGSLETAGITLGQHFLPPLRRLVDMATTGLNRALPTLDKVGAALGSMFDSLISRASGASGVGTFFASLGRYLREVAVDGDYLNDYLTELPGVFAAVARAIQYVEQTVLPGLGRAFVNLGQAVGGFLGLELDDYAAGWDTWGGIARRSLDLVGTAVSGVVGAVRAGFPIVKSALATLLPVAIAVGQAFVDNLTTTIQFVTTRVLPPLLSIVQQTAGFFLTTLQPALQTTSAVLRGVLGDTLDWLAATVWPPLLGIAGQTAAFWTGTLLPAIQAVAGPLRTVLGESIQWLADVGWPALLSAASVVVTFFSQQVAPMLPDLARRFRDVLGAAITWVAETGWPSLVSAGQIVAAWVAGTAIPAISGLVEWLGPKVSAVLNWLIDTGWPMLVSAGQTVSTWVMGTALPALTSLVEWLGPKTSAVVGWLIDTGWPMLTSAAEKVSDWMTGTAVPAIGELWSWLEEKARPIVAWLIDEGWPNFVSAATGVSDWIKNDAIPRLMDLWSWLEEKSRPVVQWFIDEGWPALQRAGNAVATQWDYLVTWAERLWEKLSRSDIVDNLRLAFSELWDAGKILIETFFPDMKGLSGDLNPLLDAMVTTLRIGAGFALAFATGVKTIAEALREMKSAINDMPDWAVKVLQAGAFGPAGSALGAGIAGTRQNQSANTSRMTPGEYVRASALARGLDPDQVAAVMMKEGGDTEWDRVGAFNTGTSYGPLQLHYAGGSNPQAGMGDDFTRATGIDLRTDRSREAAQKAIDYALDRLSKTGDFREWYGADKALGSRFTAVNRVDPRVAIEAAGSASTQRMSSRQGLAPMDMTQFAIGNQFELGLPIADALSACGPAAVAIFMQMMGRTPNASEVMRIASKNGWTEAAGMGGPAAFMKTLSELGVEYAADWTPTQLEADDALLAGRPVAFSTAGGAGKKLSSGHYFVAQGYDLETGKFDFGETAGPDPNDPTRKTALKSGSRYMTWEEVTALAGPVQALITLMNDVAPAAVAAGAGLDSATASVAQVGDAAQESGAAVGSAFGDLGDTIGVGVSAVQQGAADAQAGFQSVADTAAAMQGQTTDELITMQTNAIQQASFMADGVVDAAEQMQLDLLAQMEAARQAAEAQARALGQDLGGGVAEGIDQSEGEIRGSLNDVLSSALDDLSRSFDIHSPSGRTRREVGRPLGAGVARGIEDMASDVDRAWRSVVALDGTATTGGGRTIPGGGQDGGIDYDRLERALVVAARSARPQNFVGTTEELKRQVRREQDRDARRYQNLFGGGR